MTENIDKNLSKQVKNKLPKINGHQLDSWDVRLFEKCMAGESITQICADLHINSFDIIKIRKQEWFKNLEHDFIEANQQSLHLKLMNDQDAIAEAYLNVINGTTIDGANDNAIIKAVQLYVMLGKTPLLAQGKGHEININSKNKNIVNQKNYNLDLPKLKCLNSEQLLEINNTGVIPDEYKIIHEN